MASKNRQGCCCTGKRCLILQDFCVPHDPIEGADVKVYEHGTDNLLYDLTTKKDGKVCWDDVPGVTKYDVDATKDDYDPLHISGDDEDFSPTPTYYMHQKGIGGVRFLVRGCLRPLPDAVVTIDGIYTGTTDANGFVHLILPTGGVYPYTITHPSGRFNLRTGNVTVNNPCAVENEVNILLEPTTDYRCCATAKDGVVSPIPASKTMFITTVGGTDSFTSSSCVVNICLIKSMSNVGGSRVTVDCIPPLNDIQIPPVIGVGDTAVQYTLDIDGVISGTTGTPHLTEGLAEDSMFYQSGGFGTPFDQVIRWRVIRACSGVAGGDRPATGITVNSLAPNLSITFTIPPGNGYGPYPLSTGITPTGQPYSPTVTISE